jgi:hypothetical protein
MNLERSATFPKKNINTQYDVMIRNSTSQLTKYVVN